LTLALPLPVVQATPSGIDFRKQLNVPSDAFVSLYLFDLHSTVTRKNPQAVVRVFLEYAKKLPHAYLFLKINRWNNMGPNALNWLPNHPRIKVIKDTLSPGQLADLYRSANCYLSLHRSEGFGRTLVEALQHGLYVVSTNFSGPADFLTNENSLIVDWTRRELKANDYLNFTKSWWAEPNETTALQQLEAAFDLSCGGPNMHAVNTGKEFEFAALASRYKPILSAYLRSSLYAKAE
jgi:glycosyltransferase involved in cell wall biosynthesis